MAVPTITNGSGVTFTFNDGDVESVRTRVASNIEQTEFPASGPSEALLFDFNGPLKIIEIQGLLTTATSSRTSSGTTTTILQQKQWLESNINGNQTAVTFTSTYDSQTYNGSSYTTTKIMVGEVSFEEMAGEANSINFDMRLLVGTD